jgi:hypothetical protein
VSEITAHAGVATSFRATATWCKKSPRTPPNTKFRREATAAKPAAARAAATDDKSRVYEAFDAKDNQRRSGRLGIRRKGGMSHAPGYNYIIDICCDQDHCTGILQVLGTMLVKIRGRNLKPIVDALLLGHPRIYSGIPRRHFREAGRRVGAIRRGD